MMSSIENLNPYEYKRVNDKDYRFLNADGIEYQVYFSDGSGYFEHHPFANFVEIFGFRPLSDSYSIYDKRVAETVVCILIEFFIKNEPIIIFVCDEKDRRQANRSRLFNLWFNKYNDDSFEKIDLVFEEHTFVSAIIAKNNPFYIDFKQEFPNLGEEYK
jgi:Family of unknown function (DUF6169)